MPTRFQNLESASIGAESSLAQEDCYPPGSLKLVNPLEISGWDELVQRRKGSTFFHGTPWMKVLQETFRFQPLCFAEMNGKELASVFPVMEVRNWLTGNRGVSLPFADFCPPLAANATSEAEVIQCALEFGKRRRWKYLEWRGDNEIRNLKSDIRNPDTERRTKPSLEFYAHELDLRPEAEALFKRFDSTVRRSIRKAERLGVKARVTTAPEAIEVFHQLYCLTRQRHGLPPQSLRFFRCVHEKVIASGNGFIVEATHMGHPVASNVFFTFGKQALYKYGASDYTNQELRANNLVMWTAIQWLVCRGCDTLHLGRTSLANDGLRRFKRGWGAVEYRLPYHKYDFKLGQYTTEKDQAQGWHTNLFRHMPISLARILGFLLYRHAA